MPRHREAEPLEPDDTKSKFLRLLQRLVIEQDLDETLKKLDDPDEVSMLLDSLRGQMPGQETPPDKLLAERAASFSWAESYGLTIAIAGIHQLATKRGEGFGEIVEKLVYPELLLDIKPGTKESEVVDLIDSAVSIQLS